MPNNVTKPPILDNTGQSIKSKLSAILSALQSAASAFIPLTQKGAANGVASLDANGKIATGQMPNRAASSSDGGEATTVKITAKDNESSTWYYPPFQKESTTSTAGRDLYTNNGLRYKTMLGTTETDGEATVSVGNATASGTAGNKTGYLRVYGSGTGYGAISFGGANNSKAYTLPNKNGTFALTDDLSSYVAKSGDTMTGRLTMVGKPISQVVTGSGTVGQDKGSGQTNRYVPSEWVFDTGVTVADGDIFTIKIPVAGISYGVWVSMDNGTTYYPVAINGTTRLGTQYVADSYLTLQYENAGSVKVYDRGGSDSSSTVTQIFRVLNYSPDSTKLPLAGGTMTGALKSQDVTPKTDNTYNLGSSNYRYKYAYVQDTIYAGKSSNTSGKVLFYESHGTETTLTASPKATASRTYYLPEDDTNNSTLTTRERVEKPEVVDSTTVTATIGSTSQTIYLFKFANGMKCIHIASSTIPSNSFVSAASLIPSKYRPVTAIPSNNGCNFSGFNAQYDSTSAGISKTRFGSITADGKLYIYGSAYAGFYATYYYV